MELTIRSNRPSATELDRSMKDYAQKLLSGNVSDSDRSEYERLLTERRTRLVKLSSPKILGAERWFKKVSQSHRSDVERRQLSRMKE